MSEIVSRSIRFPKKLWEAIDMDSSRSKRSSVKQMEAILMAYYKLENVDLDKERISDLRAKNPIENDLTD